MMDINRNHWLIVGIVMLALGVQFRLVESAVLNEECSVFIAKRLQKKSSAATGGGNVLSSFLMNNPPPSHRTVTPPKWIGWLLLSGGGVVVLHSMTMRKPGG